MLCYWLLKAWMCWCVFMRNFGLVLKREDVHVLWGRIVMSCGGRMIVSCGGMVVMSCRGRMVMSCGGMVVMSCGEGWSCLVGEG